MTPLLILFRNPKSHQGAGLSFSKCHAELKVPVDVHTPGIFDGEEFNRAARFWTYGYDIYTPNRVCKSCMVDFYWWHVLRL
jgi:hypothetical protein